jgi:hypothetical protein
MALAKTGTRINALAANVPGYSAMTVIANLRRFFLGFNQFPIPQKRLINLRKYKYNSTDLSLLSKYLLGPYWNALVQLFPLWVAY